MALLLQDDQIFEEGKSHLDLSDDPKLKKLPVRLEGVG